MHRIAARVIPAAYELLPVEMRTGEAARLILAIGSHASGYEARRLTVSSSRRGFWLLGVEQVAEVLKFTKGRAPLTLAAGELGYRIRMMERLELQAALEHNDIFSVLVARCMLPPEVDRLAGASEAWEAYRRIWEPRGAAADGSRWAEHFATAGMALANAPDRLLLTTDAR